MPAISTVLLYVDDPAASARFYAEILGHQPLEMHPNFAMLTIAPGVMLGLWKRSDVQPAATSPAGAGELAIAVATPAEVSATCSAWAARGIRIVQQPVQMDFGFTGTALDPDGHRLRVMALG